MTCIVGLEHAGKVHIGGDSAGSDGYSLEIRAASKVFIKDGYTEEYTPIPWAMGFTTSFRMGQLLRHKLELPKLPKDAEEDLEGFMVTKFIDAVRESLRTGGWLKKSEDRERGGTFLVGVRGQLFTIYDDLQVGRVVDGYAAVGCGDHLALGSLFTTKQGSALEPEDRVRLALRSAARHSAGVSGPFTTVVA
jgi:ATP-dependent protease HslVU (ClpYQ) peptidase subunit